MNLSDNLKKIRKDNNLSQEELAEKLGVSRQSVSKWESGLAYPEMDKVLELCKIFNLNIDELLNQDIKEVEQNRVAQSSVSKYIDSFLSYISRTVNLLSSMKFKTLVKCIFEQILIAFALFMASAILWEILERVIQSVFTYLPESIYYPVINILDGLYILAAFIAGVVIMLHIFKVRYLDYYTVVDKEEPKEETTEEEKELTKEAPKKLERKEEKIVIRDPEHSGYKFINGLVKVILFFIKCFAGFIGIGFACSLVGFVACFVLSFLIAGSGLLFAGALLGSISAIVINLVILDVIISFIFNRRVKKGFLLATFLISLLVAGVSCGLIASSFKDFRIIDEYDKDYYNTKEVTYKMTKDTRIAHEYDFVESKNNDIKIVYQYPNFCKLSTYTADSEINAYQNCLESPEMFKSLLNMINDKTIVDDRRQITVYTTKENIKKISENNKKYYESQIEE